MSSIQTETKTGGRLRSIDALRGIAALGVVVYHTVGQPPFPTQGRWDWLAQPLNYVFSFGYVGVFLFFVISGFCIHLQWAKQRASGHIPKLNFKAFWKRRLLRLYPPYLFALALYLGLMAYTIGIKLTPFFIYDTVMHLLMLHNLDQHTAYSINGVFWTLAIEEQLYLAYFLLLFIRIRWGWKAALTMCAAVRVGWFLLSYYVNDKFHIYLPISESAAVHWFTWALGAISIEASLGLIKLPDWCRRMWVSVLALTCGVAITYTLPALDQQGWVHHAGWLLMHPVWGFGFFALINCAVLAEVRWRARASMPRLIALMAWIGLFSYSLYLTHQLVIMMSWRFIFDSWPQILNTLFVLTPAAVAFAWVFYRMFERPFMRRPAKATAAAATTAQSEKAPTPDVVSA